jgi:hypothetical protein
MRISTRTLKTIKKNGLHATAKKHGIDLSDFVVIQDTPPGTMPNVRPLRPLRPLHEEVLST